MRKHGSLGVLRGLVAVFLLTFIVVMWNGCSESPQSSLGPKAADETATLSAENPQIKAVMAIQDRYTADLMANPEVVGTATTLTDDGKPAILVMTKNPMQIDDSPAVSLKKSIAKGMIPATIEAIPVVVEVTGVIRPLAVIDHQVKQTPPIQLGTSGSWRYDLANGYCCGGTLGSLVQIGTTKYVLSNYHVLLADIVAGGNNRVAVDGDPVTQPGLIDVSCNANNAQNVATIAFANNRSLPNSNVDAALAQIISGMVREDGAILEVGTISKNTVAASLRQKVKKSGRTTGLTRSTVKGLNSTVSVTYDNECAGGTAFTKTFTGQIILKNTASSFLAGGDSGSLMVEDKSTNPRAIGLLFAGSSTTAVANPIGQVLSYFGATMVGQ